MLVKIKKKKETVEKKGKKKGKIKRKILYSILFERISRNKINGNGNCVRETF